jgi:hypothetical protein
MPCSFSTSTADAQSHWITFGLIRMGVAHSTGYRAFLRQLVDKIDLAPDFSHARWTRHHWL